MKQLWKCRAAGADHVYPFGLLLDSDDSSLPFAEALCRYAEKLAAEEDWCRGLYELHVLCEGLWYQVGDAVLDVVSWGNHVQWVSHCVFSSEGI